MGKMIGEKGLDLIKSFEGCRLTAYQDAVGIWTIGYGHTGYVDYKAVEKGMTITLNKADKLLKEDCQRFADYVDNKNYCRFDLNENERDALISFAYNCGQGNLKTLCDVDKKEKIADRILLYNRAGGKVLNGLVRRRKAERELFLRKAEDMTEKQVKMIVKEMLDMSKEKIYTYTNECPEWARGTVQKLLDKGAIAVTDGVFNLPEGIMRTFVIMDRMGIL